MKNYHQIIYVLILGILLAIASTEAILAEDVTTEKAPTSAEEPSQPADSFLDKYDLEDKPVDKVFFPKLTKVLQSIGIVIVLIVGTVFFLRKKFGVSKAAGGKKYLHVIESVPVGAKRFILMVKVPGKLLVVGMANDQINPLSEITDKEVVEDISPSSDNSNFMSFIKKSYLGEVSDTGSAKGE